jgi:SAM-dependent methyltransferase
MSDWELLALAAAFVIAIVFAIVIALVIALAIYPGELSWLSTRGTRWLYDRAAENYERKHARHDYAAYDAFIARAATALLSAQKNKQLQVLDLGCGTGRATLAASAVLGDAAHYTAVDFSPAMLEVFRAHPNSQRLQDSGALNIQACDVLQWLESNDAKTRRYELILLMELGEFLPGFPRVLTQLEPLGADGATLVMTRPAGIWAWCFPGRAQRRSGLSAALAKANYRIDEIRPWRGRYELLRCSRTGSSP